MACAVLVDRGMDGEDVLGWLVLGGCAGAGSEGEVKDVGTFLCVVAFSEGGVGG